MTRQKKSNKESTCSIKDANKESDIGYLKGGKITFLRMSYDYGMMCPNCHIETRYISIHISKSNCHNDFKEQFNAYKADYRRDLQREINKKSIAERKESKLTKQVDKRVQGTTKSKE
jgi:hypothetical protein